MKLKLLIAFLLMAIFAAACAPTMQFDQTCITCFKSQNIPGQSYTKPKSFLSNQNCLVTIVETGENIYLNKILTEEKLTPVAGIPITLAKVNGKIYLTGDGFSKLWIISPMPENKAKFKSIDFPIEKMAITDAVFTLDNDYSRLKLSAQNLDGKVYILVDDSKWILENSGKAGE